MRTLWAYAYRVSPVPPVALDELRRLLDAENAVAFGQARAWAAQLIVERRATRILVISDTPRQNRAANRRLESTLHRHGGAFRRTAPVALGDAGAARAARSN